jgi:tetratricopeptide (TPR) repeat protein
MDSLITAAARALAVGDPIGALKHVALRDDAPALALRGIAMAQLGDFARAKILLKRAARAFGPREALSRARCIVAEAEVALAARDLAWPVKALDAARAILEAHGDRVNAAHARYVETRRLLLVGRLDDAERALSTIDPAPLPPASRTVHELLAAGIAVRRLHAGTARDALARANRAVRDAGIPALAAEVDNAHRQIDSPAARLKSAGDERPLLLGDVETLLASNAFIVDACRYTVRHEETVISLARRPVLFALARTLAESWPGDAPRDELIARAFGSKFTDESHRARLRVEMGRLRRMLRTIADIRATKRGFTLAPLRALEVFVLARPIEEEHGAILALLGDSEPWATSALSLALGMSQRTVQRALDELAAPGKVQAFGRGRARRWTTPPPAGFTTTLLLPSPLPIG